MNTPLTSEQAAELTRSFRALSVETRHIPAESCEMLADGSYGPIVVRHAVVARICDTSTGNAVAREIREHGANVVKVLAEMNKELRAKAKLTRARIAAEKAAR